MSNVSSIRTDYDNVRNTATDVDENIGIKLYIVWIIILSLFSLLVVVIVLARIRNKGLRPVKIHHNGKERPLSTSSMNAWSQPESTVTTPSLQKNSSGTPLISSAGTSGHAHIPQIALPKPSAVSSYPDDPFGVIQTPSATSLRAVDISASTPHNIPSLLSMLGMENDLPA